MKQQQKRRIPRVASGAGTPDEGVRNGGDGNESGSALLGSELLRPKRSSSSRNSLQDAQLDLEPAQPITISEALGIIGYGAFQVCNPAHNTFHCWNGL